MKKLALEDIMGIAAYQKVRERFRQRIIELKQARRVAVGDKVTLVFENRDTMAFQIQEMVRAENISDLDKIREEIDVYNELIPEPGELSATLFLEIEDQSHLREDLLKFLGIDEAVYFNVGSHSIHARFEAGHSKEDKISAVQYVKFPFNEEARTALIKGDEAAIVIDHPNYKARTLIEARTRQSLVQDLTP
ncbi:MAG: DUF3501 family protein [Alphaproteobacteria bacterium]